MSPKTVAYLAIFFTAILVLALGGWLVNGVRALTGGKRQPGLRSRYA